MAARNKENWWSNISELTGPMDLAIPKLAQLKANNPKIHNLELNRFCEFLERHPLAEKHEKRSSDLRTHMKMNIRRYLQGLPFYH